jgi:hypothetical protein
MTIAVLSALTFAVKPYYRQHLEYGSPPLAIRTGLMAFACTPILIALAGKANIVTLLTGISHERLNVIHRWVAWMSLVLSGLHGFPFFMQSSWEGSFYRVSSAENVKTQFYFYGFTGGSEVSAVPITQIKNCCSPLLRPVVYPLSPSLSDYASCPSLGSAIDSTNPSTSVTSCSLSRIWVSYSGMPETSWTHGPISGRRLRCGYHHGSRVHFGGLDRSTSSLNGLSDHPRLSKHFREA